MSSYCGATIGRNLVCKNSLGGVLGIYFANYPLTTLTVENDIVTSINGSDFYKFEVNNTSNYIQNITLDKAVGLKYYNQEINMSLPKMDSDFNLQLKKLIKKRFHVVVQDRNGSSWLFGYRNGMRYDTGQATIGGNLNSFGGYNLKFISKELAYAYYITGSTLGDPFGEIVPVSCGCNISALISQSTQVVSGSTVLQGFGWISSDIFSLLNGYLMVN